MNEKKSFFSFKSDRVKENIKQRIELATDNDRDYWLTTVEDFKNGRGSCSVYSFTKEELEEAFNAIGEILNK